ncbi:ribosomal large subunit pseudouridine synthase D [Piscinibacter sakaiensis]|uniref:Pseudouridine synthase n=1 Tax=Piscinibacter sakaiensis TaxID=1547922 RepID=A0A0K8P735_PISS1|nr:ribosomal large subunit pseudouridine synthase D [Piscinibacter sakaiensis]
MPDEDIADASDAGEAGDVERRSAVVDVATHGQRLDKALVALAPEFSRAHLQRLIADGHVRLDGAVASAPARRLAAGQAIEVALWPTQEARAFRPEPMPLPVVYEDEALLVIDKPAGWVVHPAAGHWSGTLMNGLLAHHAGAAALPRAGIVHRLDKDTSGLLVVGKTLAAVTALSRAIARRDVRREYLALVHGRLDGGPLRIDAPIGRDPRSRVRMAVVGGGRPAMTDVEPLAGDGRCTAVRCRLHTGRTHQIRVHLASRGHPLVGDVLYGGRPERGVQRQALHAAALGFAHPVDGRPLHFGSPLPPDLAAAFGDWAPRA